MLASYTYGHSIDGGGNQNDTGDPGPQESRNLSAQKGSSNFDVRHRFVLSGLYQMPFRKSWHALRELAAFRNFLGADWPAFHRHSQHGSHGHRHDGAAQPARRWALPSGQRRPSHWFDTSAFVAPTCVCFGNSGRNILRGPHFTNIDLGVMRDFIFRERFRLQFRAEAFNLFNHPNFGIPNVLAIGNPQVGIITTVVNPERQIQAALKLYF